MNQIPGLQFGGVISRDPIRIIAFLVFDGPFELGEYSALVCLIGRIFRFGGNQILELSYG